MHPPSTVAAALELAETGVNATEIGRELEIPRSTVRDWLAGAVPHVPHGGARCSATHQFAEFSSEYVYLLGLYLRYAYGHGLAQPPL